MRDHYDGGVLLRKLLIALFSTQVSFAALTYDKLRLVKEGICATRRQRKFSGVKVMIYGHESPARELVPHNVRVVYRMCSTGKVLSSERLGSPSPQTALLPSQCKG